VTHKTLSDYKALLQKNRVGGQIEVRCSRCKEVTDHTVVAMVDGWPVRVMCNRCKSQHNNRRPKSKTEKPRSTGSRRVAQKKVSTSSFSRLLENKDVNNAHPYDRKQKYDLDQLVIHPKFGLGVVVFLKPDNKMIVRFEDGERLLLYARS
jgi:phage FluMu protein Com